jgi:hypothetical protein
VIENALSMLQELWRRRIDINIKLERLESNPQFIQAAASGDPVILILFTVKLQRINSIMSLCFPFLTIQQVLGSLQHEEISNLVNGESKESYTKVLQSHVQRLYVQVSVRYPASPVTFKELLELKKGDIISLVHVLNVIGRYFDDNIFVCGVGLPTGNFEAEKTKLKEILTGTFSFDVDGEKKTVEIILQESDILREFANDIIDKEMLDLKGARVKYLLAYPYISKKIAGKCIKASKELKYFSEADYLIEISNDLWNVLNEEMKYILLLNQLLKICPVTNEKTGVINYKVIDHDFKGFAKIIKN